MLFFPGSYPELFILQNTETINNYGMINDFTSLEPMAVFSGSAMAINDTWLYLYEDGTFLMILPNSERVTGTYEFVDGMLIFTLDDGTVFEPAKDADGNWVYSITAPSGYELEFVLTEDLVSQMQEKYGHLSVG